MVLGNIAFELGGFVDANRLGRIIISPMDVFFSDEDVLKPDLLFISKEGLDIIGNWVYAAPDLVVEVVEIVYPETAKRDRGAKHERYERFGVRECWMVELSNRTVEVLAASDDGFVTAGVYGEGDEIESPLLTGLRMNVSGVFESAMI